MLQLLGVGGYRATASVQDVALVSCQIMVPIKSCIFNHKVKHAHNSILSKVFPK